MDGDEPTVLGQDESEQFTIGSTEYWSIYYYTIRPGRVGERRRWKRGGALYS